MGEGRRRKLAGEPPKGPKREKAPSVKRIANELFGGMGFAEAMAILTAVNMRTRFPARELARVRKQNDDP